MQQWYPTHQPESAGEVYAHLPPPGRDRWVAVNMVMSVDGAVTVDGVSGPLGGEGDLAGFRALRAAVDVVLVGAGTARAEGYGPAKVSAARRRARRERGQAERPAIAVVTASLDLQGAERLLTPEHDLLVVTSAAAPADRRADLERRGARVVVAGQDDVDLADALAQLAADGYGRVLAEGGPRLNRALLAAGVVDDLFVTVAPTLVGGDGPGLVAGALDERLDLALCEGRFHDGELLLRYRVLGPRPPAAGDAE
jgi:riboflavin-specific deaminase-like protein